MLQIITKTLLSKTIFSVLSVRQQPWLIKEVSNSLNVQSVSMGKFPLCRKLTEENNHERHSPVRIT